MKPFIAKITPTRAPKKARLKAVMRHSVMACALSALLAPLSGISDSNQVSAAARLGENQVTNRERKSPKLKLPGVQVPMDVVAENLNYDSDTKIAVATGDVFASYQEYRLRADKLIYDRKNGKLRAIGNVWWREKNGNVITGDDIYLDDDFANGFGNFVRWMLTDGSTITAAYAKRVDGKITYFTQSTYTRCQTCVTDSGRPLWQLNAKEAEYIEDDHRIHYYNTTMEFLGVPIFWLPWISYPDPQTKRASGFLAPSFKFSDVYGVGVETPYFWNLAPNYDVTFLPVWNTKQGLVPRAVWRHDVGDGQYWVDASGVRQLDRDFPPPGDKKWRGAIRSQGQIELNNSWDWGWKAVATSDKTYLKRYGIYGGNDLINTAYLVGLNDRNYFSAETYEYKSALSKIDNNTLPAVLPYIQHYYKFDDPVLGGELGIDTNIYSLWRERNLATALTPTGIVGQGTQATRASTELHWQRQIITNSGVQVTPFGRLRADFYSSNNVVDTSVPTGERGKENFARVLPLGGMDMRWPIISSNAIGQHIFTPAAQIIAGTNETDIDKISNEDSVVLDFDDTNLFLHNRFTGNDRYEGGTRANLGLIYTYLMDNGGFAKFSVGESFHLAGKNSFLKGSGLNTKNSDIVLATAIQFNEYFRLSYTGRFENKNLNANRHEVGGRFSYEGLTTAVNYGNVDPAVAYGRTERRHQIWGNAKYQFDNGWSLFAGSRYDLETSKFVRSAAGFAFDCDCYNMRVTFVQNNTEDLDVLKQFSVLFSIEFKTLGGARFSRVINEGER
ncbi:MAG: LPS-assembly protein LptD [Hyphomicrobiales bacterium]